MQNKEIRLERKHLLQGLLRNMQSELARMPPSEANLALNNQMALVQTWILDLERQQREDAINPEHVYNPWRSEDNGK